jgi:glycosyltransferase involved in cell wall biosynthesis
MKIVYFYQYFTTPKGSYGTRVYEFTKRWVELGHEVTVVTSVYAKSDIRAEKFIENQIHDGVKVKVINVGVDNKQGIFLRIWSFVQYMVISSWYGLTLPADLVISSSGPITAGIPGLVARYVRRRKFVFEVRDLWPEVAIDLGVIRNRVIIKFAYWLEKRCYLASHHIIALSPGMKADIERRFGLNNVTSITNSANIELFSSLLEFPNLMNLQPKKYALYTGNIGEVNNSNWLFEAALILRDKGINDFKIVLVGDGQQKDLLRSRKEELQLETFEIFDLMPKTEVVGLLQNAMISLVPLKGNKILDTSSPNKFFESLAAGVPVIQNTNGWMKDFLRTNEVGFTLNPESPEELADLLIRLIGGEVDLSEMGNRAKKLSKLEFDKNILSERMLRAITNQ